MFLIKKLYTTASNQTINLVYSAEQFNLLWKLQWENEWREIKKKKFFFIKKKGFKKQLNLNSIVENQNLKLKDKKTSFLIKDFSLWAIAFLVIFILAITIPFESFFSFPLVEPYNALGSTPEGIKPEWYFYFIYYPMELLPFWVIIIIMILLVLGLFLVPRIFSGTSRKTLTFIAIIAFIYFVIMTVFGQQIFELIKGGHSWKSLNLFTCFYY